MSRKVIGFHNPEEPYGFLSNWYKSKFTVDGVQYTSMEQYMMHQKALTFNDVEIARQILNETNPARIKRFGREIRGYNDTIWNGVRQIVVYSGLMEKFRQSNELNKLLFDTEDAILAECAVQDRIWGIGLSMSDPDRFDINRWRGQNLLGFSLMKVRETI